MSDTSITVDPISGNIVKVCDFYQGLTEAAFYQMIDHPSIVKVTTIDFESGTIRVRLVMKKLVTLVDVDHINYDTLITDILDAVTYLESNDILHNDIKPDNIMYDPDTDMYVLIDFGVSTRYSKCHIGRTGTMTTKAPEIFYQEYRENNIVDDMYPIPIPIINDVVHNFTSDIFSLGATLYALITGYSWLEYSPEYSNKYSNKYSGEETQFKKITNEVYTTSSDEYKYIINKAMRQDYLDAIRDSKYYDMIKHMMDPRPENRMTALQWSKRLGIDHIQLRVQEPIAQTPDYWDSRQIESIVEELKVIQFMLGSQYSYLVNNASKLVLTYFALKRQDEVEIDNIPLYLYCSLVISQMLCNSSTLPLNYGVFIEYLKLWQEGTYERNSFYNLFQPQSNSTWDHVVENIHILNPNLAMVDIALTVNFRTMFEFS